MLKVTHRRGAVLALLVTALFAGDCQTNVSHSQSLPAAPSTPGAANADAGSVRYGIDAGASELRILVYRGGAMARMGHNHVVSSKTLSGSLWLHPSLERSRLEITLPVASLVVDDPEERSREGEDFGAQVPRDAREGTRRNLLRQEVLDGERHPTITLRSIKIGGSRSNPQIGLRIAIKGVERDVSVSAVVNETGKRLSAAGEFTVKQTDFGIKPFRVALGALQVQDQLKIKFSIVCLQQE